MCSANLADQFLVKKISFLVAHIKHTFWGVILLKLSDLSYSFITIDWGVKKLFFFSWIEPVFLYGMCIGHTRSHVKFQTSSLNDLTWPPLFVNGSYHQESHTK